jgi:WD40 repeat protein
VTVLREAARRCPAAAHETWPLLEATLVELRRDDEATALAAEIERAPDASETAKLAAHEARGAAGGSPPDGHDLTEAAASAAHHGDLALARSFYDRALAAYERAEHAAARSFPTELLDSAAEPHWCGDSVVVGTTLFDPSTGEGVLLPAKLVGVDAQGKPVTLADLPGKVVKDAALSPNGRLAAYVDDDGTNRTVRLWDPSTRTVPKTLFTHDDDLQASVTGFTADSKTLVVGEYEANQDVITLWDVATGALVTEVRTQWGASAASTDGARFAVLRTKDSSLPSVLDLVDIAARKTTTLAGECEHPNVFEWSPDGALLAVGTPTGKVCLVDAKSGRTLRTLAVRAPETSFDPHATLHLDFTLGGRGLQVDSVLFRVATGERVAMPLDCTPLGALSTGDLFMNCGGEGPSAVLLTTDLHVRTPSFVDTSARFFRMHIDVMRQDRERGVALDARGSRILLDRADDYAVVDTKSGKVLASVPRPHYEDTFGGTTTLSPSGQYLYLSRGGAVTLREANGGRVVYAGVGPASGGGMIHVSHRLDLTADATALWLDEDVLDLSGARGPGVYHPTGLRIVAVGSAPNGGPLRAAGRGDRGFVVSNDVAAGDVGSPLPEQTEPAAFSGDGSTLATVGPHDDVYLWSVPSLAPLRKVTGFHVPARHLALDATGSTLLVVCANDPDGTSVWDVKSGALLMRIPSPRDGTGVGFGADGSLLVQRAEEIDALDVRSGRKLRGLAGKVGLPSPDDRQVLVILDGQHVLVEHGAGTPVQSVDAATDGMPVFAPNSRHLLLPSYDGQVHVWDTAAKRIAASIRLTPEHDAAVVATGDRVELLGDRRKARALVRCAIGTRVVPLEVCADRMLGRGVLPPLLSVKTD